MRALHFFARRAVGRIAHKRRVRRRLQSEAKTAALSGRRARGFFNVVGHLAQALFAFDIEPKRARRVEQIFLELRRQPIEPLRVFAKLGARRQRKPRPRQFEIPQRIEQDFPPRAAHSNLAFVNSILQQRHAREKPLVLPQLRIQAAHQRQRRGMRRPPIRRAANRMQMIDLRPRRKTALFRRLDRRDRVSPSRRLRRFANRRRRRPHPRARGNR